MSRKVSKATSDSSPDKISVLDGKLHIYKRERSPYWQCGFHHKGVYIRSNTKLTELDQATEAAKAWYYGKQTEIKHGIPVAPKKDRFEHYAKQAIADYEAMAKAGRASPSYAKAIKTIIDKTLIPYFGNYPLSSLNQKLWNQFVRDKLSDRKLAPSTIKHFLNGLRVVFRRAKLRGEIEEAPKFITERKTANDATPRTWFTDREYVKLLRRLNERIDELAGTRWHNDAKELLDYVQFIANSGLRVGEAKKLRFCDVEVKFDKYVLDLDGKPSAYLEISNIQGKRGTGVCKTHFGAAPAFLDIIARRNVGPNWRDSKEHVFIHHHRDMFNKVLVDCGLKFTNHTPPLRRDLMSLRNTYICRRLIDRAPIYDIAANCRTSVAMIQDHYARWLSPFLSNINYPTPQQADEDNDQPTE